MEEKIKDLEARLVKLEKVEKRRKMGVIINIVGYVLILVLVIYLAVRVYLFIKPIKDTVDNLKSFGGEKIDQIKDGFSDFDFDFDGFSSWFN